jgi:hypothetical protein
MENMSLLNDLFNSDDIEISNINKLYLLISIVIIIFIGLLLIIKKDNYYSNSFSFINDEVVVLVEKEYINEIQNSKTIYLDDIKCDYSINKIEPIDNSFLVNISLKTKIENIKNGNYKIIIGKERIFDYIIKTIK